VDCSQSCYYPVCCSVLQCVAVCCSELQFVAVHAVCLYLARGLFAVDCSQSRYHPVCCSVLYYVAVRCSALQCVHVSLSRSRSFRCGLLPFSPLPGALQCVAVCCSVLQRVAVRVYILIPWRNFCCRLLPILPLPGVFQMFAVYAGLRCAAVRVCVLWVAVCCSACVCLHLMRGVFVMDCSQSCHYPVRCSVLQLQCVAVRVCFFISCEESSLWTAPNLATTRCVAVCCSCTVLCMCVFLFNSRSLQCGM